MSTNTDGKTYKRLLMASIVPLSPLFGYFYYLKNKCKTTTGCSILCYDCYGRDPRCKDVKLTTITVCREYNFDDITIGILIYFILILILMCAKFLKFVFNLFFFKDITITEELLKV